MQEVQTVGRDPRLIRIILVLGALALFFIVIGQLANLFSFFADILLTFFLAWLLAFIISPIVSRIVGIVPRLPRALATVIVYTAVVLVLVLVIVLVAGALATSIGEFVATIPQIEQDLPSILRPWQEWLNQVGLSQIDLAAQASALLANVDDIAAVLVQPLQSIAVASVSVIGTMLIVFFLSIYMVVDRDQIMAFLFRIVPPTYAEEARLLQTSVSRSFGGFLRGQALMGSSTLHRAGHEPPHGPAARRADIDRFRHPPGDPVLRTVPVLGAAGHRRAALQARCPRPNAGPHDHRLGRRDEHPPAADHAGRRRDPPDRRPRSVLIGSRLAGVAGAVFGIPVAAVVSAFFFHFLHRSTATGRCRAGRPCLSERDGKPVHVRASRCRAAWRTSTTRTSTPRRVGPRDRPRGRHDVTATAPDMT
jgi:predicted PurR-regulated permease PerM